MKFYPILMALLGALSSSEAAPQPNLPPDASSSNTSSSSLSRPVLRPTRSTISSSNKSTSLNSPRTSKSSVTSSNPTKPFTSTRTTTLTKMTVSTNSAKLTSTASTKSKTRTTSTDLTASTSEEGSTRSKPSTTSTHNRSSSKDSNDHLSTPSPRIAPTLLNSTVSMTVTTSLEESEASRVPGYSVGDGSTGQTKLATSSIFRTSALVSTIANASSAVTSPHSTQVSNNASILNNTELAANASATMSVGGAKCTEGSFVDASCFNELHLTDYISHWWTINSNICNSKGVQFAECFYALETKYAPSDCAQINEDSACVQPIWTDFNNTTNGVQNFYVAWNLWNTAGFFLDMWTAISDAQSSCQAGLASIINLLDPAEDEDVAFTYVLDALTFGLSLYAEGSIIVKALLRSIPQGVGVTGKIFPSGTVDGEYQDWSEVAANVGKFTDSFRSSVAQALPLIENNVTTFIMWSQVSGLSGHRPPLHGLSENLTQTLNTYAIANIISTQGIVVSRAANTDVHALQTNGSQLNWDTGCGGGYDANGVCDTFFWDGIDTFGLTDPNHYTRSFHDELTSFFTPNGRAPSLTTGRLLFSGAQNCYIATGKNGGANPSLDPADASHILCLSNLQVCTWDKSGYGPFDSSCKNLPDREAALDGFGASGCSGEVGSTMSIDVPRAYLGPGIYQDANNIEDLQSDDFCDNVDF